MKQRYLVELYMRPRMRKDCDSWVREHERAVCHPIDDEERSIVELFSGWLRYADTWISRTDRSIKNAGVLGDDWALLGSALRGLIYGQLGCLDRDTLDRLVRDTLSKEGFDPDDPV